MLNRTSCIKNGFEVCCSTSSGGVIYIKCSCHKSVEYSRGSTHATRSISAKKEEDRCGFRIVIKKDPVTQQFYIRQNGGSSLQHNGHFPTPIEKKYVRCRHIEKSVMDDAERMLIRNAPQLVVQDFVEQKTGLSLSPETLTSLRASLVSDKLEKDQTGSKADALLRLSLIHI